MAKRKAEEVENSTIVTTNRRSTRRSTSTAADLVISNKITKQKRTAKDDRALNEINASKTEDNPRTKNPRTKGGKDNYSKPTSPEIETPIDVDSSTDRQQYWLLKAEPETRLERGCDVKFSIDDLAARTKPEPWDGVRAFPARSNLRSMKKGDLAFFYHSNCKVPAIAGVMEIVQEHSPDLSAQDPKAPYFDPKDTDPTNPKWSVVHVEFRHKLEEPITLKELREFANKGGPLENMQMLKQSRLSVSKVSKNEWDFLFNLIEDRMARKVSAGK